MTAPRPVDSALPESDAGETFRRTFDDAPIGILLGTNPTDRLVVRTVVELARGLGAETIAEFVGDDDAILALRELGGDDGQGFHLGRPAPVGEIPPVAVG